MSNNSNLSLSAKNISQYATIGSAFLGGLVGFFIGKSIGPSEPESESEPISETVSEKESKSIIESSEPIALSSSPSPVGQTMGFVPVSTTAENAQEAVLQEPKPVAETEVKVEEEQVFPSLALAEEKEEEKPVELVAPVAPTAEPLASLEPTINPNPNPNGIEGGKMRSTRRKPRKPRQRASRKYGGQAVPIVPPTSV